MNLAQRKKCLNKNRTDLVSQNDEVSVYKVTGDTGYFFITKYRVFPGIDLIYNDVHMQECAINYTDTANIIEINHCREGRIECRFNKKFFYLAQGDLSITRKNGSGAPFYFPLNHYNGITILIDSDAAPSCLSCFLDDVNVKPTALIDKFCNGGSDYFVMRSEHCIEHLFSELYSVPECIKKGYFKVKILELLLFLSGMNIINQNQGNSYSKQQSELAKSVQKYLMEHMDSHITIDQLSTMFLVSPTQLKSSFKSEYGASVYSFIRTQKMQNAAGIIKGTDKTILDIAGQFGYNNGSKFAKAFRDVMGVTPKEYRAGS